MISLTVRESHSHDAFKPIVRVDRASMESLEVADGKTIQPTGKKFHIEFCTVATWKEGKIVEERLFYDMVGMLKQIGTMS